jgi:hypothetical protein
MQALPASFDRRKTMISMKSSLCRTYGARHLCRRFPSPYGLGYLLSRLRRWTLTTAVALSA